VNINNNNNVEEEKGVCGFGSESLSKEHSQN